MGCFLDTYHCLDGFLCLIRGWKWHEYAVIRSPASSQGNFSLLGFLLALFISLQLARLIIGSLLWILSGLGLPSISNPVTQKDKNNRNISFWKSLGRPAGEKVLVSFYFIKSTAVSAHKSKLEFLPWQVISTGVHTWCLWMGSLSQQILIFPVLALG